MENKENLATIIANNLVYYRKKSSLTQSELANKLNYSDKSISKWERAEGTPDIFILSKLADLYGITVDDFLSNKKKAKIGRLFASKILITCLAVGLVWFISTLAFSLITLFCPTIRNVWNEWLLFIYAIPISCIVLIVFNDIYFKKVFDVIPVSVLCWSIALSIHLSFASFENITYVYFIAIPFQVLIVMFYLLLWKKSKK